MLFFLVMHKQNYFLILTDCLRKVSFKSFLLFFTQILKSSATSQTPQRCRLIFIGNINKKLLKYAFIIYKYIEICESNNRILYCHPNYVTVQFFIIIWRQEMS